MILIAAVAIIAVMLLFPPFYFFVGVEEPGRQTNFGYSFMLHPPILVQSRSADDHAVIANVNWPLLITQWLGVLLMAAMSWLASKD